jgi:hypothetical protein
MRLVSNGRSLRGDHDICQQRDLGLNESGFVESANHRHGDAQQIVDQSLALPPDTVPGNFGKALSVDLRTERIGRAGDDNYLGLGVTGHLGEDIARLPLR